MLHKNSGKILRERLMPIARVATLLVALCTPWYAACAQAQEAQKTRGLRVSCCRGGRGCGCRSTGESRAAARALGCSAGQPQEPGEG